MKKLFVVLCVAAIGFAFTSCKKECVCTGTQTLLGEETNVEVKVGEMSKKDCEAYKYEVKTEGVEVNVTCKSE